MRLKPVTFVGDARDRLRRFPEDARQEAGHQLYRVQQGLDPERWKTVRADRLNVQEIRITAAAGEFRVIYVANRAEVIYVLHAFHKKSQKMSQRDYRIIASRIHTLLLRE
jgi:phage-related protein